MLLPSKTITTSTTAGAEELSGERRYLHINRRQCRRGAKVTFPSPHPAFRLGTE